MSVSGRAQCSPSAWRRLSGLGHGQDGAVALILAAVLAGLVGTMALVFDLGRAWNLETELQAAVDAAALAGATQLDGGAGARVRAAEAAAGELARNAQIFANASGPGAVTYDTRFACNGDGCAMTNENIRFLASLAPRADALSDAEARFIEISAARTLRFAFASLIGAPSAASPRATAVAAWDRYVCGRPALLLCSPDEPSGNLDPRVGFDAARHFGAGLTLRDAAGGPLAPGLIAWLAVVLCDPSSDTCTAKPDPDDVADGLGRVLSPQSCIARPIASAAATDSLAEAVNMRMDIYPSGGAGTADDPDFQPSPNFLTGLVPVEGAVQGGTLAACDFPGALRPPEYPFLGPGRHAPLGSEPLDHLGYPRDNCAYPRADGTAPPDNCIVVSPAGSGIPPGRQVGTGVWDLPAYMAHHHAEIPLGAGSFNLCPAAGCRLGDDDAVDLDNDRRLSRWEVYAWELRGHSPRFGRPQCFGGGTAALPQAPADPARVPDRRLLGAAIVNCNAVEAAFGADALDAAAALPLAGGESTVSLFLTEALGELAPDAFYAEIVDPAAIGGAAVLSLRDRIVLPE